MSRSLGQRANQRLPNEAIFRNRLQISSYQAIFCYFILLSHPSAAMATCRCSSDLCQGGLTKRDRGASAHVRTIGIKIFNARKYWLDLKLPACGRVAAFIDVALSRFLFRRKLFLAACYFC